MILRTNCPTNTVVYNRFLSVSHGWTEMCSDYFETRSDWATVLSDARKVGFEVALNDDDSCAVFTIQTRGCSAAVLFTRLWRDECQVSVIAETADAAKATLTAFAALLPPLVNDDANTVDLSFWSFNPMQGGVRFTRALERRPWTNVERNYSTGLRPQLEAMCGMKTQPRGGRMMVFHGPPGTGKSSFLQTLATEWATWCDCHYVVDPDMMFQEANYLTRVMLDEAYSDREKWRLVIIEDGDEFISKQAKTRTGHSISRLLNVADGLVGQGLKVMVLVSTNVRNAQFNQAIIRPGRCGANIEFPAFTPEEATEWCAANGVADVPAFAEPVTLARLYGLIGADDAQV